MSEKLWRNGNPHMLLAKCEMISITLNNSTPRCLPKVNENIYSHKNLHTCHNSTIHKSQTVGEKAGTKCPLTGDWINKMWHYIQYYYLAFYQKEWNSDTCSNMNECWKYHTEWMKPVIDSSKDEETTSREKSSLVVLDD